MKHFVMPCIADFIICGISYRLFFLLSHFKVPAKESVQMPVVFKSRFLRACESTLVLCGKRVGSAVGSTLVFILKGFVDNILPLVSVQLLLLLLKGDVLNIDNAISARNPDWM